MEQAVSGSAPPIHSSVPAGLAPKASVLAAAANLVGLDQEPRAETSAEVTTSDKDDMPKGDAYDDDDEDEGSNDEAIGDTLGDESTSRHTGAKALFLQKLYDILENDDNKQYICWCNRGERVLIKDHEGTAARVRVCACRTKSFLVLINCRVSLALSSGLSQVVLPQYYNHANFKSFVRQLHMYSFRKLQMDSDSDWCGTRGK